MDKPPENNNGEEEIDQFSQRLQARLYRWDCPTPDELGNYELGYLNKNDNLRIALHLETCLLCREEINVLQKFSQETDIPTDVESKKQPIIFYPSYVRKSNAFLQRGSVRGDTEGPQRFTFATEDSRQEIILFLGLHKTATGYVLNGQFEMNESNESLLVTALVEIWQEDHLSATAIVDEFGTFACALTQNQPFTLRLQLPNDGQMFGKIDLS
ncbi:MAG: hypothetical protein H6657_24525 [Ardenticatenaceae bacterium]|nr:hypothetical protein [Ardenticatenaceae bacterium]